MLAQTYAATDTLYNGKKRNIAKEAQLLARYTEKNQLEKTLSELDAWQDTFKTGYDAYYADDKGTKKDRDHFYVAQYSFMR